MELENVPASWYDSLHFIMLKESGGRVGVKNPDDSCRGLFQLNKDSYYLNPHGTASFGNGVEEAQGGIRYIKKRYRTAGDAMEYWQHHNWY
jgi:SLT domain-containing protein